MPNNVLHAQCNNLGSCIESFVPKNTDTRNIDSKDIIKALIKESSGYYKVIEMLVQAAHL